MHHYLAREKRRLFHAHFQRSKLRRGRGCFADHQSRQSRFGTGGSAAARARSAAASLARTGPTGSRAYAAAGSDRSGTGPAHTRHPGRRSAARTSRAGTQDASETAITESSVQVGFGVITALLQTHGKWTASWHPDTGKPWKKRGRPIQTSRRSPISQQGSSPSSISRHQHFV